MSTPLQLIAETEELTDDMLKNYGTLFTKLNEEMKPNEEKNYDQDELWEAVENAPKIYIGESHEEAATKIKGIIQGVEPLTEELQEIVINMLEEYENTVDIEEVKEFFNELDEEINGETRRVFIRGL